jgi:hypothetical protein
VRLPSGADVADVELSLDGAPLEDTSRVRGLLVDPGVHVLKVSARSSAPVERTIVVAMNDHERTVEIVMAPPSRRAPVEAPAPPDRRFLVYALGGLGLALLGASAVAGLSTLSEYRGVETRCGGACASEDVSSIRTRGLVTDVLLGAGLVTLAAATIVWLTSARHPASQSR